MTRKIPRDIAVGHGEIHTRDMGLRPGDDRDTHHRGKEFSAERAAICDTCTRPAEKCNGVCHLVLPDNRNRKKAKEDG